MEIRQGQDSLRLSINGLNQIDRIESQRLQYDANGNLLNDGQRSYQWDGADRLIQITDLQTGVSSEFTYDGYSRRTTETEKDANGQIIKEIKNIWCGETLCAQQNKNAHTINRFFAQGEVQNGKIYLYAQDQVGSVYALIDSQGKVAGRTAYDPYGNITMQAGVQPIMAYAGLYQHKESGLHLATYRAYNSATARWLNRDPIREMGGLNIYAYVNGDPVNMIDPLGLWAWGDPLPQGVVNAAAGFGDGISFGGTDWIRGQMGTNGSVDKCSLTYSSSKYAGYAWGIATVWSAGLNGGANSVFWSGTGNMDRAAKLGTSLESTPIGALMNRFGEYVPYSMWKAASGTFAANAKGEVIKVGTQLGRIWSTVEAPILNARGVPVRIVP